MHTVLYSMQDNTHPGKNLLVGAESLQKMMVVALERFSTIYFRRRIARRLRFPLCREDQLRNSSEGVRYRGVPRRVLAANDYSLNLGEKVLVSIWGYYLCMALVFGAIVYVWRLVWYTKRHANQVYGF